MASNNYQWPNELSILRVANVNEVDPIANLTTQVLALTSQISALTTREAQSSREPMGVSNASFGNDGGDLEQVNYLNNWNFNYRGNNMSNNLPTHYHPVLRNHENFSYANNRNVLQPPLGFNQPVAEKKPSLKDILSTFIMETKGRFNKDEARIDNIETHCNNINATMKSLEVQIRQLANSIKGQIFRKFPSDTETNPKDHCKTITLRSRKEVEVPKQKVNVFDKAKEDVGEELSEVISQPKSISFPDNPPLINTPLSYPQRFQKKKLDSQFAKFIEIFKKLHINIPFADALQQMSNYVKFMKDVMSKKRRLDDYETVKLME
ncbi:LOW QUALITY PROTEIN: hypothetical protein TorRG33x02_346970 [Trema orientale]|uniref:Uncharacterized protein n=1 Tax=Trema orientale TaxID=63057 RepID=A0A2P5AMA4_TREOI|nr:LOW QUALITY PROTEIN: hypothetical protein TorRG33x02_346970 [Trema orientale]